MCKGWKPPTRGDHLLNNSLYNQLLTTCFSGFHPFGGCISVFSTFIVWAVIVPHPSIIPRFSSGHSYVDLGHICLAKDQIQLCMFELYYTKVVHVLEKYCRWQKLHLHGFCTANAQWVWLGLSDLYYSILFLSVLTRFVNVHTSGMAASRTSIHHFHCICLQLECIWSCMVMYGIMYIRWLVFFGTSIVWVVTSCQTYQIIFMTW